MDTTIVSCKTLIVGSGLAGFNAADSLYDLGYREMAILTEDIKQGTSRNTGSDKQTYYKLSLCSDQGDSVYDLAKTLFDGGSMHGDTALIESAYSLRSFMKLVQLGVDFPRNHYGEFVGYKTDHDPRQRATSCGPYTSKSMVEALEKSVRQKNIKVYDRMQAVRLLVEEGRVRGLIALALDPLSIGTVEWIVFQTENIILATGGPAGIYYDSAYPRGHTGMSGLALMAGAEGANLQEWQYGLASLAFPWNLSGTYQQVLPTYLAEDRIGKREEFLVSALPKNRERLENIFLKGYQWPFDIQKIPGSSEIDWLVYQERFLHNRRIYLDFRHNPQGFPDDISKLKGPAKEYLLRSGASQSTPLERLRHMNSEAIALYQEQGIDLAKEPLEIALCAQHHNGGIGVDENWQTSILGLYAAGEVAGTFGIYRPGGSALNSTQTGSLRAAEAIANKNSSSPLSLTKFKALVSKECHKLDSLISALINPQKQSNIIAKRLYFQKQMSRFGAQLREVAALKELRLEVHAGLENFSQEMTVSKPYEIAHALKNQDILITTEAVLSAMEESAQAFGSRGSALVVASPEEVDIFQLGKYHFKKPCPESKSQCILTQKTSEGFASKVSAIRPLPHTQDWFETIWKEYREKQQEKGGGR